MTRTRWGVMLLLALHLALVLWGAARNSVTFDENFHVPAGVVVVARHDFGISAVNPPLVKVLCALPPLALGARLPDAAAIASRSQYEVGESFMRLNASRYHELFVSARVVVALLSLALAFLIWRVARRFYGSRAGLLALAFYATAPEALAHGGLATLDVATALGVLATVYTFWCFASTGRWRCWALMAVACGLTFLTRFTAILLGPMLLALAAIWTVTRTARRPRRLWLGLVLLAPATLLIVNAGYLGHTSFAPLAQLSFIKSPEFLKLRAHAPWLRLPLPDDYLAGLDHIIFESQPGFTWTYLAGKTLEGRVWYYVPLALLFKLPLGFLAALPARVALLLSSRRSRRRLARDATLAVPVALTLATAMFGTQLNSGVRYVFNILPPLCVWLGALAIHPARRRVAGRALARWALAGWLLVGGQALETALAAPWYLSFFNRLAGGPGGGDRLVNDSNVDWGQGLIALREELERRGIRRVHLAYHGTTDPALYGIDYVPYMGGEPGPESDWLAVSSYYFVGLTQRMMTRQGRTDWVRINFRGLWDTPWAAHPAGCIYLFRVRQGAAP